MSSSILGTPEWWSSNQSRPAFTTVRVESSTALLSEAQGGGGGLVTQIPGYGLRFLRSVGPGRAFDSPEERIGDLRLKLSVRGEVFTVGLGDEIDAEFDSFKIEQVTPNEAFGSIDVVVLRMPPTGWQKGQVNFRPCPNPEPRVDLVRGFTALRSASASRAIALSATPVQVKSEREINVASYGYKRVRLFIDTGFDDGGVTRHCPSFDLQVHRYLPATNGVAMEAGPRARIQFDDPDGTSPRYRTCVLEMDNAVSPLYLSVHNLATPEGAGTDPTSLQLYVHGEY